MKQSIHVVIPIHSSRPDSSLCVCFPFPTRLDKTLREHSPEQGPSQTLTCTVALPKGQRLNQREKWRRTSPGSHILLLDRCGNRSPESMMCSRHTSRAVVGWE